MSDIPWTVIIGGWLLTNRWLRPKGDREGYAYAAPSRPGDRVYMKAYAAGVNRHRAETADTRAWVADTQERIARQLGRS